jgi:PAS domain S-box-containing protein
MSMSEDAIEENRRLRRTMRDLVALSTLPAVWTGLSPEGIAHSLVEVLRSTLSLDLVYVRMAGSADEGLIEIARTKHGNDSLQTDAVIQSVAPLLASAAVEPPTSIPDPWGTGMLNVAITRFGVAEDSGVLVTGSRDAEFPTERDRLLLGVGANQTAIVVQRRRAEEQLREQGERLRTTLASIGDAVITTDVDARITNLNPMAEVLTGWSNAEAVGRPLDSVFRIVNEASRQTVESPAARALRDGLIIGLGTHTVLIAKDGSERPIEDSASAIRCAQGEVVGCVLIFRDITQRKRTEESLYQSYTRFEALFNAAPVGVYLVDAQLRIRQVNPKARPVFGSIPDLIGSDFAEVIHLLWPPSAAEEVLARFRHTLETGEPFRNPEFAEERHDLHEREYYDWQINRILLPDGQFGVVCYFMDISPHIQARRELAAADRRKDEFLATLAHELRNPLAPLRNGLQVMKLAANDGAAIEQCRTMMERQVTQLVRLVDDLLDLSRIATGKFELRKERVSLASVVTSAIETSRPLIEQMGHVLDVSVPRQPVFVHADFTRLAQVFMNLLNNAAKYSNRGGQIRVSTKSEEGSVVFHVQDTGIGIAPDKLGSIFEMFSQVDRSLEKSQGGLGIGLTLVKRLVEMHGGTVEAHSEGPGKGSEFTVRLPILDEAIIDYDASKDDTSTPASALRILVVDDNRDSADSLAMMLKVLGNETLTAYDGHAAIACSQGFRPDVILLDIGLPKLNGYDTCRALRAQPEGNKLLIVAQTGWGQESDRQRTRDAGFDHHLVKPVDPAALMELLAGFQAVRR